MYWGAPFFDINEIITYQKKKKEFKEYCATHGIRMKKTNPRTPQQNGMAKRMKYVQSSQ